VATPLKAHMRERVNVRGSLLLMGLPYPDGRSTGPMRPQRYTTPLRKGWWLQPHAVEELLPGVQHDVGGWGGVTMGEVPIQYFQSVSRG
jgi:hypothetical protein